jgi:hypothetical protein
MGKSQISPSRISTCLAKKTFTSFRVVFVGEKEVEGTLLLCFSESQVLCI